MTLNGKVPLILCLTLVSASACLAEGHVLWQEAEGMEHTGTWSNDPQHIDIMGSVYLLAAGLGKPVDDAVTTLMIPEEGTYAVGALSRLAPVALARPISGEGRRRSVLDYIRPGESRYMVLDSRRHIRSGEGRRGTSSV